VGVRSHARRFTCALKGALAKPRLKVMKSRRKRPHLKWRLLDSRSPVVNNIAVVIHCAQSLYHRGAAACCHPTLSRGLCVLYIPHTLLNVSCQSQQRHTRSIRLSSSPPDVQSCLSMIIELPRGYSATRCRPRGADPQILPQHYPR
jgi:hypothetical protein